MAGGLAGLLDDMASLAKVAAASIEDVGAAAGNERPSSSRCVVGPSVNKTNKQLTRSINGRRQDKKSRPKSRKRNAGLLSFARGCIILCVMRASCLCHRVACVTFLRDRGTHRRHSTVQVQVQVARVCPISANCQHSIQIE